MTEGAAPTKLREWRERPHQMVEELFGATPDPKQREVLEAFPHQPRIAMQSCTGAGKTTTLSWLAWNFLLTRPHPIMGATSINGDNLKSALWPELARWRLKAPLLENAFELTGTQIFNREHPKTWKLEARTWPKDARPDTIGNALRGLHGDYIMWILDESGGYPEGLLPIVEAIFSGNPLEAHIVQAGNPTQTSGPLYAAAVTNRAYWFVVEITADPDDPNRTPRVSIEHARQQIKQYGRDNPWVKVNIFGQFPPSSFNALLGPEEVREAMGRKYQQHDIDHAARVLGVDVARYGDDASCLFPRQGLVAFKPNVMRHVNGIQGAGQVARVWADWDVDAVFIDNTGGYGAAWIDQLSNLNRHPIPIEFSGSAMDKRYANKRAEMYFLLAEWVKGGGALPDDDDLVGELTQTTYTFKGDALLLEPKDIIKAKLGRSPDKSDALALTFAAPVQRKNHSPMPVAQRREERYDPYSDFN